MKFLSTLLLFGGYLLIYAATAKSGRFAAEPWEGLFNDAYTGERTPDQPDKGDSDSGGSPGQPGPRLGGPKQPFPRRGPLPSTP